MRELLAALQHTFSKVSVYDDVIYVHDDVTYVYDNVTHSEKSVPWYVYHIRGMM